MIERLRDSFQRLSYLEDNYRYLYAYELAVEIFVFTLPATVVIAGKAILVGISLKESLSTFIVTLIAQFVLLTVME